MSGETCGDGDLACATIAQLREVLRWRPGRRPLLLAHRGAPDDKHAENCLATYEAAWRAAPCFIEVDVRATADGVFVLHHDAKLDRTTTGTGLLSEHGFEQLRALRLRDMRGRPTEYRVETLADVLEWARGRTVVFLDVKDGPEAFEPVLRFVGRREAHTFCVTLTYEIADTVAVHQIAPEAPVYGRATNEAFASELLESGIPHDRLVAWIHDETPPGVFDLLHAEGILTTYGTFLEVDRRAATEGLGLYDARLAKGADILNTDNVPRATAAVEAFIRSHTRWQGSSPT